MKDDWEIVVHIYVNMDKLAEAYRMAGVISREAIFREFVKGFNAERRLFEYVDAGNDKEAADRKVQSTSALFSRKSCALTLRSQRILSCFGITDTARLLSLGDRVIEATPVSFENSRNLKKTAKGLCSSKGSRSQRTWKPQPHDFILSMTILCSGTRTFQALLRLLIHP